MAKNVKKPKLLSKDKKRKNFAETDKKIKSFCQKSDRDNSESGRKKRVKKRGFAGESADFATMGRVFGVYAATMSAKIRKTLIRH